MPSLHKTGAPAMQTPLLQISSPLQKFPSLQSSSFLHCVGEELGTEDGLSEAVLEGCIDGETSEVAEGKPEGGLLGIEDDASGLAVGTPVGNLLGIDDGGRVVEPELKIGK